MRRFENRTDGGQQLAAALDGFRDEPDVVVLGLPRGGVPVAAEVARALGAPLDVIVVRKVGLPIHSELAMGAIGEGGVVVRNTVARSGPVPDEVFEREVEAERRELEARLARLRRGRSRVDLTGKVALIVDDGLATGATASAACEVARKLGASRVVVATPVAPEELRADELGADELTAVRRPRDFRAVGAHYRDFRPTEDDEVASLLGLGAG